MTIQAKQVQLRAIAIRKGWKAMKWVGALRLIDSGVGLGRTYSEDTIRD